MTDVIASPSVRALALEKGIDLEKLAGDLRWQSIAREDLQSGIPLQRSTSDTA